ncbi:unnamed protein product [Microthlaspi erraticum]|uniref:Uncharacterized protein n=1 Tax=Microthlaspi erraticum TaxID=1685480 RepID=A0A6D2KRV6_9BRAS|nr:unnamed protein product [Microthlaspi erraticum]
MEQLGREEQGRTWYMDSAWPRMLRMMKEAVLKSDRPIHSTNRSSSPTRPAKDNSIELLFQESNIVLGSGKHGYSRSQKMVFAVESSVAVGVLERPKAWPSFKKHSSEWSSSLSSFSDRKMLLEPHCANRGVFFIAQSVIKSGRKHSYVALGPPF